jgi:hypothetical protein
MSHTNCRASLGVGVIGVGGRDRDAGQPACSQLGLGRRYLLADSRLRQPPTSRRLRAVELMRPVPPTNNMLFTVNSVPAARSGSSQMRC